jgi:transposase
MKPVGKPDAGNPHVRFDERGEETGLCLRRNNRASPRLYKPVTGESTK